MIDKQKFSTQTHYIGKGAELKGQSGKMSIYFEGNPGETHFFGVMDWFTIRKS